jgi:hypothetical protein
MGAVEAEHRPEGNTLPDDVRTELALPPPDFSSNRSPATWFAHFSQYHAGMRGALRAPIRPTALLSDGQGDG